MACFSHAVVRVLVGVLLATTAVVSGLGCSRDTVTVPAKRAHYERPLVEVILPPIPETPISAASMEPVCATIRKNSDVTFRCQFASESPRHLLVTIVVSQPGGTHYGSESLMIDENQTRLVYYNRMPISCRDSGDYIVKVFAQPRPASRKAEGRDSISIDAQAKIEVIAQYRISVTE